jgi:hypothetical protein
MAEPVWATTLPWDQIKIDVEKGFGIKKIWKNTLVLSLPTLISISI